MKTIVRNSIMVVLLLGGLLCIGVSAANAQNPAGARELAPIPTNIAVNPVSIPNIPLRIGGLEVQDTGRSTFALKYSISNEGPSPASLVRLTLILFDSDGVPKGGESWTSREYLRAGETRSFLVPLKSSFSPNDKAAISILNASIGGNSLDSSISSIMKAAKSGLSSSSEPASPVRSGTAAGDDETTGARCASPVLSNASAPIQDTATTDPTTPQCDPVTFCNGCAQTATNVCGLGRVASYSCDAGKCICSFTCKTATQATTSARLRF